MRSTTAIEKPSARLRRIAYEAELRAARQWRDARSAGTVPKALPGMQAVACGFDSETPELSSLIADVKQLRELLEGVSEGRLLRVAVL